MTNDEWTVYVRDADYKRVAQVDEIHSMECIERHLAVGTWVLELPFQSAAADALLQTPGSGIEVRHRGRTRFSGPMLGFRRERTVGDDRLIARGTDDMVALQARVLLPEPHNPIMEVVEQIHAATSVAGVTAALQTLATPYGITVTIAESTIANALGYTAQPVTIPLAQVQRVADAVAQQLSVYPSQFLQGLPSFAEVWLTGALSDAGGAVWGVASAAQVFVDMTYTEDPDEVVRFFNHEMAHVVVLNTDSTARNAAYSDMVAANDPAYPYGGAWISTQTERPPGYTEDPYSWTSVAEDFAEIFAQQLTRQYRTPIRQWVTDDAALATKADAVRSIIDRYPRGRGFTWGMFDTKAHDMQVGPATSVLWRLISRNAGPDAVPTRAWPGLTMDPDPAGGESVTVGARWQSLIDVVADVGGGHGVSVTIRAEDGGLVCSVRVNRDRTNVELSPRSRSLQGWTVESSAPEVTAGWAGGQGELTARDFAYVSHPSSPQWPLRMEAFADQRSADPGELVRALDEVLVGGMAKQTLTVTPAEGLEFGESFDIGDVVTVVLDGVRAEEQVTAATLLFVDGVLEHTFAVGPNRPTGFAKVFALHRALGSRVRNLEGT